MELSVFNIAGQATSKKVTLSEEVFGIEPNNHVMWLDVKQYLANQRQGTHKSKERWEVSRSTRKLVRQKGTGGARHGSFKANIFKGGARTFGPQPRDYSFKINKKVKGLARKSALATKAKDGVLSVIENFTFDSPKTKQYITLLNAFSLNGTKTLLVLSGDDSNVYLSARNLPKANVLTADQLTTYAVLNADRLLVTEGAIARIEALLN